MDRRTMSALSRGETRMSLTVLRYCLLIAISVTWAFGSGEQDLIIGVNERIANHHDARLSDVDSIWAASRWLGATWVRENLVRPEIETAPDTFGVPPLIDAFIRARPSDMRLLVVLGFASRVRTPNLPVDSASIDAYRRYLEFVVGRYANNVDAWQIWNEPNLQGAPETPPVSAEIVATATRLTRAVVDSLDPGALVVGPAVLGRDRDWTLAYLRTGADTLVDVIALHYYPDFSGKGGPWRGFGDWVDYLRAIWPDKPIWVTETGATTFAYPSQSDVLRQHIADAREHGVSALFWWNLRDFTNGDAWQYRCGLYEASWARKPAAFTLHTMSADAGGSQGGLRCSGIGH